MTKAFAVSFLLTLLTDFASAQPFVRQADPFPVAASGSPMPLPFTGGINKPLHQFVDIDGDNDFDLFVFDEDLAIDFFRNEGTRLVPNFKLRNEAISLPRFSIWFRFLDFDSDGKIDLCTEDTTFQGTRVFKNTGTQQSPQFTLLIHTLRDTNGADVFTGGNSIPAFFDIDGDGDLDLFSGNLSGTVNLYRNVGTRTQPRYAFATGSWENILIFGDSCSTTSAPVRLNAHGATAYTFADIDGDNDLDMFIGDLFSLGIFSIQNIGTPLSPHMQCWVPRFPQNEPLTSVGFNQTSFVDIDGDGDLDMFAGTLAGIVQRNGFIFYRNNGTVNNPLLRHVTSNFISTIDVGMNANAAFVDIDADGDQDMFVGNLNGELSFFHNTGSATSPSFSLADSLYLRFVNNYYFAPAFVDIDGDGDFDLIAGMFDGTLKFFRNNGSSQTPQFALASLVTDTLDVGFNATPAFVDIDNDGDKDLFIGNSNGTIRFYRNAGGSSTFVPQLVSATFLNISIGGNTNVTPTFSDYDGDGDFDLFFGRDDGRVTFYENIGTSGNPQFVLRTTAFGGTQPLQESAPRFVDIDGDGDQDLFVGTRKGGLHFYRNNRLGTSVGEGSVPMETRLMQNYPNPFNPTTTIRFTFSKGGETLHATSLHVFDVLGREVATLVNNVNEPGEHSVVFDASTLASGVYFYQLRAGSYVSTKAMLLLR